MYSSGIWKTSNIYICILLRVFTHTSQYLRRGHTLERSANSMLKCSAQSTAHSHIKSSVILSSSKITSA